MKFSKSDYKIYDVSKYKLREVDRKTALALSLDYAIFFTIKQDNYYRIYTWLSFNEREKIHFPDFEGIDKFFVDANYVTDKIIKEYTVKS